jgi:hypothetical protein
MGIQCYKLVSVEINEYQIFYQWSKTEFLAGNTEMRLIPGQIELRHLKCSVHSRLTGPNRISIEAATARG